MKDLARLLSFLRPAFSQVALSVLAGVATISAGVGLLGTSAYLIAAAALHPSIADLQVAIVGVRFFGISRGVFRYFERLVSHSVNLKVLAGIRVWFYQAIEPLAPARLQSIHSGDLLQRAMGDIETLENFYVRCVSPLAVALITGGLASWFLGTIFPPLSGVLAAGLALNGIALPALMFVFSKRNARKLTQARAESSAGMVEFIQNLGVVQVFGGQKAALARVMHGTDLHTNRVLANRVMDAASDGIALLISNLTLLGVLWWMIPAVDSGTVSGVLLAVAALVTLASFEGVTPLPLAAQQLNASLEAARRLFDLAQPGARAVLSGQALLPDRAPDRLAVQQVSFAYPEDDAPVLNDVSFTLERGQKIAVVGPSGAGKTSLINLMLRFWHPDAGKISLDGHDISMLDEDWLRRQYGVVSPTSSIFNASLRENLLLARPQARVEELVDALHKAQLGSWYESLPKGLETWLGEQGAHISAGESQRIAMARLILQNPPFMLLDEPTANLDPANAASTLRVLMSLSAHSGILLITQDLLHLEGMDQILLLEKGRITERGTYCELVSQKGRFALLVDMQSDELLMAA